MMEYDARPVFDRVDVPTLIISGSKDSVTPIKYQEEMNLRIRKSQFLNVPMARTARNDMPDLVNLRIEKFLESLGYKNGANS